jgi:peptidoglycan L-alanyl-D-glutamate endopeptidase CwlK
MGRAVRQALAQCAAIGRDAWVEEGCRSQELQDLYWRRGRPPTPEWPAPVTYARDALSSWHGYGLAVDVISRSRLWFAPRRILAATPEALHQERLRCRAERLAFYAAIVPIFKAVGLAWGGDWRPPHEDPPHFQWGACKPSPSERARVLLREGGMERVWREVGAL